MLSMLPTEILLRIFELACLDDGRTGRSLSAVSRAIRAIAAEHRYQSLALEITRIRQTKLLLQTLNSTPEHLRRIRHLYINRSQLHTALSDPWFGVDIPTRYKKEKETGRDVREILRLAAPTLQTLTLIFYVGVKQSLEKGDLHLEDLHMPLLRELTIDCPSAQFRRLSSGFAPSLLRLCLPSKLLIEHFGRTAAETFPKLTHLMLIPATYLTSEQWRCLRSLMYTMRLHSSTYSHGPDVSQLAVMPSRPRRYITVLPYHSAQNAKGGIDNRQNTLSECLKNCSARSLRFIVLPSKYEQRNRSPEVVHAEEWKQNWLDSVEGKLGIWHYRKIRQPTGNEPCQRVRPSAHRLLYRPS
ncbi:hypothetical protein EIP86_004346 [Pleurotus ostreatoroseus]|nr:hypothetical protein EIP86_004346 [Pleurotus ostreatoroseus]